jgi:hypothetical protein
VYIGFFTIWHEEFSSWFVGKKRIEHFNRRERVEGRVFRLQLLKLQHRSLSVIMCIEVEKSVSPS